jgi:hypothetical protein
MLTSALFIVVIPASTLMMVNQEVVAGWEEKP